jgi:proline iminopeptidase
MAEATINGTTIWYEVEGEGRPFLVMHGGLGVDHDLYRSTLQGLVARGRVVWYDHRSNGRSGRPPIETLTMAQLADDAAALLAHLGLGPALVVGHSYGGFVAQELALRHPEAVAGLLLVATGPGQLGAGEVADEDGAAAPMADDLAAAFSALPTSDDEVRATFRAVLPHYVARFDPAILQEGFDRTVVSLEAMVRGFELLAGWSSVDRLGGIHAPTLVVGGRDDPVTSWPQQVRIAKRVPGAELLLLEDASHFVWLDQPDRFLAAVDGLLARLPGEAAGARGSAAG